MHKITGIELSARLSVAIGRLPKSAFAGLQSKQPVERDKAIDKITAAVVAVIDTDRAMVIHTDLVGAERPCDAVPGKWGVDEPDPTQMAFIRRFGF